jgi:hypothetical protein
MAPECAKPVQGLYAQCRDINLALAITRDRSE